MPPGRRRYEKTGCRLEGGATKKRRGKCGCRQDAGAKKKRRYKTLSLHGSATSVEGGHLRPALALFFAFDKPWAHE
jgi:hypothetical protein